MIKIICTNKNKKPNKYKPQIAKCTCGCVFSFSYLDMKTRERRLGLHGTVNCPECGKEIRIDRDFKELK